MDHQLALAVRSNDQQPIKSKQGKKDRPICSHCGVLGHTMDRCFKIHGYPLDSRPNPKMFPIHMPSTKFQQLHKMLPLD
ncbi:Zinc finger, CCHC-type superfamily [Sesbania bispinosa]|nr:Zinc finger, CCHC-type superfamily [Sesbania bispinosa]